MFQAKHGRWALWCSFELDWTPLTASWLLKPTDRLIAAAVLVALGAFVIAQAKGGGVLASFLFSRI